MLVSLLLCMAVQLGQNMLVSLYCQFKIKLQVRYNLLMLLIQTNQLH